jgi:hypothetical protein
MNSRFYPEGRQSSGDYVRKPKRDMTMLLKLGTAASVGAAVSIIPLAIRSVMDRGQETSAAANYQKTRAQNVRDLKAELQTEYVGPVPLTSAENTGKEIAGDFGTTKRGVITIHITGAPSTRRSRGQLMILTTITASSRWRPWCLMIGNTQMRYIGPTSRLAMRRRTL